MAAGTSSESVEFKQTKVTLEFKESAKSTSELRPREDVLSDSFHKMHLHRQPNNGSAVSNSKPIVVTGFGPIHPRYSKRYVSAIIMQEFYDKHHGIFLHSSEDIDIVVYPRDPSLDFPGIDCSYKYINDKHFDDWLRQQDARLYIHLGAKYNNDENKCPLHFETLAHNMPVDPITGDTVNWEPDYHRGSNNGQPCISGGCKVLETAFGIPYLISKVSRKVRNPISLHQSTNAGNFMCNFLYYRSLYYASKRDSANVLFIHMPTKMTSKHRSTVVRVLDEVVHNLLDMLPPSDQEERPVVPVIGPGYVEPGRVIIKREDVVGPIYVEPGAVIINKDEVNDDVGQVYVEPGVIVRNEERQGLVYAETSPRRKTRKDAIDDRSQQVQYAEVITHRETIATGDIVEEESHVEYAEIREGVGTLERRSVVRERRKTKPAAHSHKKQARDSRKRRRQKRNSRQRKHK